MYWNIWVLKESGHAPGHYLALTQFLMTLIHKCFHTSLMFTVEWILFLEWSFLRNKMFSWCWCNLIFQIILILDQSPWWGREGGTRTALCNCLAFCLALVMGLSRWFMQQLQCRPGAEMWESHPCLKGWEQVLGKVCASLVTCIILCQTGSENYSAVWCRLYDTNCQLVTGEFAVGFLFVEPQI